MADKLGVLKIHLPLDRKGTESLRKDCVDEVEVRTSVLATNGVSTVLITDHNTHGPAPFAGYRVLFKQGIDYIGAHSVPGTTYKVLKTKVVQGTVDKHNFIGVKCLVTWPSGRKTRIWFVQANIGRGESPASFLANAKRIKAAFKGHVVWGFDEIDEADRPDEHALLKQVWRSRKYQFCGWETYSPVIVSPRLQVLRSRVTKACDGKAGVTPHRDLVEVIIAPPKKLVDKLLKR